MDTHALSEPAQVTAIEVLAANGVDLMVASGGGYTPTPVISHAILAHNRGRDAGLADGIVITPSHNPPEDGGIKYNPPHGGPADTGVTKWIEDRANELLAAGNRDVRRIPYERALKAATTHEHDYVTPYVDDLANGHRHGGDPDSRDSGWASTPWAARRWPYWAPDRRAIRAVDSTWSTTPSTRPSPS